MLRLKIWTVILLNLKPPKILSPNFQHLHNYGLSQFSPYSKGVTKKLRPAIFIKISKLRFSHICTHAKSLVIPLVVSDLYLCPQKPRGIVLKKFNPREEFLAALSSASKNSFFKFSNLYHKLTLNSFKVLIMTRKQNHIKFA